jgi:hypothetical protein
VVRLKDVARIELGADNYDRSAKVNGAPVSGMGIYLQSGANALNTAKLVGTPGRDVEALPEGHGVLRPYDTTRFIQESAKEVCNPRRSRPAGDRRGVSVPAELARHADPHRGGAGVADRHLRRHVAVRLLDQHPDPVRHGAGHRHRRG